MNDDRETHVLIELKCPQCQRRRSAALTIIGRRHIKGLLVRTGNAVCENCGHSWPATVTEPCQHANKQEQLLRCVVGSHISILNLYRFACPDCEKVWKEAVWEDR